MIEKKEPDFLAESVESRLNKPRKTIKGNFGVAKDVTNDVRNGAVHVWTGDGNGLIGAGN